MVVFDLLPFRVGLLLLVKSTSHQYVFIKSCVFCPLSLLIYKSRNVTNYTLAQKSFPVMRSAVPVTVSIT